MALNIRSSDMSPQQEIFNQGIEKFTAEQEEVRTAAAFAAGNIAVGNLHHFLPLIVKMVEHDREKRLLSLHALKEVSTNCAIMFGLIVNSSPDRYSLLTWPTRDCR